MQKSPATLLVATGVRIPAIGFPAIGFPGQHATKGLYVKGLTSNVRARITGITQILELPMDNAEWTRGEIDGQTVKHRERIHLLKFDWLDTKAEHTCASSLTCRAVLELR